MKKVELSEEHLKQIELMAGWGMSETKIASILKISTDTFTRRKRDTAAVQEALDRGLAVAESYVGQALLKKCMQGDITAIKYWENTRVGRSERHVQETIHRDYRQQLDEARERQHLRLA